MDDRIPPFTNAEESMSTSRIEKPSASTALTEVVHRMLGLAPIYKLAMNALGGQSSRATHAREYIRAKPGARILDIGCGPADVLEDLPPVQYVGVDIDQHYIDYAKSKYSNRASFICKSVDELSDEEYRDFDIVLATGLLHHLNDREAIHLLNVSRNFLKPTGRLVTFDGCYLESGQHPIDKWMLRSDRGKFVRTEPQYTQLAQNIFPVVRTHLRRLLRVPYTVLIMEMATSESAFCDQKEKAAGLRTTIA